MTILCISQPASTNLLRDLADGLVIIFKKITVHLDPNYYPAKTFTIEAKNVSGTNRYIQSATLNGENLTKPWFYHSELVKGGKLTLAMGDKPNMNWGSAPEDMPPSFQIVIIYYLQRSNLK